MHNRVMGAIRLILTVAAALYISACAPPPEQRAEFFVFGTLLEVLVRGVEPERAEQAFADVQQALQTMHRDWHPWEPGALTAINQAIAEGRKVLAPPDIRSLVAHSTEMEVLTGGLFNAAAGGLVALWGFHTSEYPVTRAPPSAAAIQAWLDTGASMGDLRVSGETLFSSNPAVQLDFNGIAKGYAVDRVLEILARHGIRSALVNAGGDLKAVGGSPERPWRVGIRQPGGGAAGGIEIYGEDAVFTSGVDQRYLEQDGVRYPHILDPRSGLPVRGLASATVVSAEAWRADAAATALMVAGPDEWAALTERLGLEQVLVIDEQGQYHATRAMADRLLLPPEQAARLRVVER